MPDLSALARILGVAPEAVRWHLIALPSWDPRPAEKAPHGRPSVRVTALVRGRVMRAHVVEATGDDAAVLGVRAEASVCDTCEGRAERELDAAEEALALADDPDFGPVLDARRDGWIAAHEAEGDNDCDAAVAA